MPGRGEAYKNSFYFTYQILGIHLYGNETKPELYEHKETIQLGD